MASASPVPTGLELWVTHDGNTLAVAVARTFDWTLEEGATEDAPVAAGDAACTVATDFVTPQLFEFCTKRPAIRLDEVDLLIRMSNNSRGGGYRLTDVLVSSLRVQDGGGIVGLEAGLTTLTFDWREAEVSWNGFTRTYQKPKG